MATQMAAGVVMHLLLIVLASQWTPLHARSMPGEYDTVQQSAPSQDYSAQSSTLDSDMPSFATEPNYFNYPGDTNTANAADPWDSAETFAAGQDTATPTEANQYDSFGTSTEGELPYDTFVDSPEVVRESPPASFADGNVYHSQAAYANDEVFYDTSSADTIYKARDDGLSQSAAEANTTSTADDMLFSLAKAMGGCGTGNPIDDCWRCDPNWRTHRQALATCAMGFGRNAIGGKNGPIYTVTNNGDDAENPQPGTLRYGVTRDGPLWIVFASSMIIRLKGELWMTAYKTIDGRGADVHIVGGSQITIQNTNNVIVHGISIHDIVPSGPTTIRASPSKVVRRGRTDGDAIHIWGSRDVWVDHCYLAKATDGLLDATRGSSMITVSNCLFEDHNKVMLFGADPTHTEDRNMKATVVFNKFGRGLVQRLPRCRFGVFHVLNNDYSSGWGIYAIGGSEDPMILSQGNYFRPSGNKEVTKRINDNGPSFGGWKNWNWASSGDVFMNGAFFTGSGASASSAGVYAKAFSTSSRPGDLVPALTNGAGPVKL